MGVSSRLGAGVVSRFTRRWCVAPMRGRRSVGGPRLRIGHADGLAPRATVKSGSPAALYPAAAAPAAPPSAPNIAGLRPRPAPRPSSRRASSKLAHPRNRPARAPAALGGRPPPGSTSNSPHQLRAALCPAGCGACRVRRRSVAPKASKAPCRLGLTGTPRGAPGAGAGPVEPRPAALSQRRGLAALVSWHVPRCSSSNSLTGSDSACSGGPSSKPIRFGFRRRGTGGAHQAASQRAGSANGHRFPMTEVIGGIYGNSLLRSCRQKR